MTLTAKEELILPIQLIVLFFFFFSLRAFYGFKSLLKRAAKLALNSISCIAFTNGSKAKVSSLDRSGFFTTCSYSGQNKKLKNVFSLWLKTRFELLSPARREMICNLVYYVSL